MQTPDHTDGQSAFAVEDLSDASPRADEFLQVPPCEFLLRHPEFDRLNWIRWIHWIVLRLIGIDEGRKHIEPVAIARSCLRAPQPTDLLERRFMVPLRTDRLHLSVQARKLSMQESSRLGLSTSLPIASDGITNGTRARSRPGQIPSILPSTSHVASCVWPICPAIRSTDLAGIKQPGGGKPARSCLLSTHWVVANQRLKHRGGGITLTDFYLDTYRVSEYKIK